MFARVLKELHKEEEGLIVALRKVGAAIAALSSKNGKWTGPAGRTGKGGGGRAGKRTSPGSGGKPGATSNAVFAIMQANPKGVTAADIAAKLEEAGHKVNRHTVHNCLRHVKAQVVKGGGGQVVEVAGLNGHKQKVYRLPKAAGGKVKNTSRQATRVAAGIQMGD